MKRPQIIALTGLRRTGKSTLMMKIVQDYVKKGLAKNIVYFSLDEFKGNRDYGGLGRVRYANGKELGREEYLVLLDEVQKQAIGRIK